MSFWVGVGGTFREAVQGGSQRVGVGGAWRTIENMWVGVGGAWRQFYQNAIVSVPNASVARNGNIPGTFTATYELQSDGDIVHNVNTTTNATEDKGDWVTPTSSAGNAFEVRATLNSGSLSTGTTGSWLALGTTRTWTVTRTTVGITNADLTIEIRRASDSVVLDSANVVLNVDVET